MKQPICLLALIGVLLLSAAPAWAQGDFFVIAGGGPPVGTKITSLPKTIDQPGFYYLAGNLTYSGTNSNAITVNADNVTIDLMGFSLSGPGGSAISSGIKINGQNVEVRNGAVIGFYYGILSTSSNNNRVSNIRASGNYWIGIELDLSDSSVINCTASNNGGGIYVYSGIISGCVANSNNTSGGWGTGIGMSAAYTSGGGGSVLGNLAINNATHNFWIGNGGAVAVVVDRNSAFGSSPNYYVESGTTGVQMGTNAGTP
jgi:hypothetical protein